MIRLYLITLTSVIVLSGCVAASTSRENISRIDQIPMYGGLDRNKIVELKAADKKLIDGATKDFGSREIASSRWVAQGIRYYKQDNYSMAMKRFNQAWLLNQKNPNAFWGFAIVYHDKGMNCRAKRMIDRALNLSLSRPIALADAGRIYTLCAVSNSSLTKSIKRRYFNKSEKLYFRARSAAPKNGYIYSSWATAYYWRGNYTQSWRMVSKARKYGSSFSPRFIALLREKMPEPK